MEERIRIVWFRLALEIQGIEWGVERGVCALCREERLTVIYVQNEWKCKDGEKKL